MTNLETPKIDISVALLHEKMHDKHGRIVTTSITLIDVHDMARSARTYGATNIFVAHPSSTLQRLTNTLKHHWEEGHGATYNPNRSDALSRLEVVSNLDQIVEQVSNRTGKSPELIATSARQGPGRISFKEMREILPSGSPFILMLGTGWGMTEELLSRAHYLLEPIVGPSDYNHLSVRSACAVLLDRLLG